MRNLPHPIEPLESRIAPASVLTYTDIDGDHVTVTSSASDLAGHATFSGGANGQLQVLDVSDPSFNGANITVAVVQAGGGDGLAAVGFIYGNTNDLGTIKIHGDLGAIFAGSGSATTPAIKGINVASMGIYGKTTLVSGAPNLNSEVHGALGSLKVAGDMKESLMHVFGGAFAKIGSIFIGGALADSGFVDASGAIGPVHVGTIVGEGRIRAGGDIGTVSVPGGIVATPAQPNPAIESTDGGIASVTIGGTTIGTAPVQAKHDIGLVKLSGFFNGLVESTAGSIGTVKVAGSLRGSVRAAANIGATSISGDDRGALVATVGKIASVKIGGSMVEGGIVAVALGPITVAHDLISNTGQRLINAFDSIVSLKVGGSVIGIDPTSAVAVAQGDFGSASIAHDLVGTAVFGGHLRAVKIGGSVTNGGRVFGGELGHVTIVGDLSDRAGITSQTGGIAFLSIRGSVSDMSSIQANTSIGTLTIGHNLAAQSSIKTTTGSIDKLSIGDSMSVSSTIEAKTDLRSLRIGHAMTASTVKTDSGEITSAFIGSKLTDMSMIEAKTRIGTLSIGGDVEFSSILTDTGEIATLAIGGTLRDGASLKAQTSIGTAIIGGNLDSSTIAAAGGSIDSLTIRGSIVTVGITTAAINANTDLGSLSVGGSINAGKIIATNGRLGAIKIAGSVFGSEITSLTNIDTVSIGGNLVRSTIKAIGVTNLPTRIGSVSVHGVALDSNILAGVKDTNGDGFGNGDDTLVASTSTIASIIVGGVVSDGRSAKPIAFEAEEITSLKIGNRVVALQSGSGNDTFNLSIASDYKLHEVP